MSKTVVYKDADGEKNTITKVQNVERNGQFFRVTYSLRFSEKDQTKNIRSDRVISYDE